MADVPASLAQKLVEVGASIHVPEHSLWPRVRAELEPHIGAVRRTHRQLRVLVVAAVAVLVVLGLTMSIPPARRAVADLLGLGSTTVERVDRMPADDLPGPREVLPPRTDVEALRAELARAGLHLPATRLVGTPVAWNVAPAGETVVAFADVVFGQRGEGDVPAGKRVPPSGRLESTTVAGAPALRIEGPHTRTVQGREYRSDSALVWTADGMEFRLEGDLDLASMRRVAASVEPARA